jgi:hypothetical protein
MSPAAFLTAFNSTGFMFVTIPEKSQREAKSNQMG